MTTVRDDIYKFMSTNGIMTLSTSEENKPWSCTVYYGLSEDFTMYVVTDPDSKHGQHIQKNPNVAFSIFDSATKVIDDKKGIQGQGTCVQVHDIVEATKGLMLWHRNNPGAEKKITVESIKKFMDTRIFKISPNYIKFCAKELYGESEYGEIEL